MMCKGMGDRITDFKNLECTLCATPPYKGALITQLINYLMGNTHHMYMDMHMHATCKEMYVYLNLRQSTIYDIITFNSGGNSTSINYPNEIRYSRS